MDISATYALLRTSVSNGSRRDEYVDARDLRASLDVDAHARQHRGGGIEYGTKQAGRFSEETVAKLVRLFQARGVVFLPPNRHGAGIRYLPLD
jgi:hypothetical protein